MLTLTLELNKKAVGEYRFDTGKTIKIGRRNDNDIVINNLGVSGRHAKIEKSNTGFLLTDLDSTNGSFVNQEAITSKLLNIGDIITIGKHTLHFSYDEKDVQPEVGADKPKGGMDQTMVIDTEEYRSLLAKKEMVESIKKQDGVVGALAYVSGGRGEVVLSKKMMTLGKSTTSDIIVRGLFVGKTAASISKRVDGYYLSYSGGWAKPKLNGEIVKEVVRLNEFDIIEIGSIKLQLISRQ